MQEENQTAALAHKKAQRPPASKVVVRYPTLFVLTPSGAHSLTNGSESGRLTRCGFDFVNLSRCKCSRLHSLRQSILINRFKPHEQPQPPKAVRVFVPTWKPVDVINSNGSFDANADDSLTVVSPTRPFHSDHPQ
jgi:Zn-dependent M28 family amino/carboxypeptidase